jgi:hypothetical protein
MQDLTTRWVELAPLKETDSESIMEKFMMYWILRYGPPIRLLTDRGANLISAVVQRCCKLFGIEKVHTTAYRPQGNGANERMHQELTKHLSIYLADKHKSHWHKLLQFAAWVHNTSYHMVLKCSPYEVLVGQIPPMAPFALQNAEEETEDYQRFIGVRKQQLWQKRKEIQDMLLARQEKWLTRENEHKKNMEFQMGDYVLYKNHNKKTKWDVSYLGPYKIIGKVNPVVYELNLNGYRFSAHVTYLKPYKWTVKEKIRAQKPAQMQQNNEEEEEIYLPIGEWNADEMHDDMIDSPETPRRWGIMSPLRDAIALPRTNRFRNENAPPRQAPTLNIHERPQRSTRGVLPQKLKDFSMTSWRKK